MSDDLFVEAERLIQSQTARESPSHYRDTARLLRQRASAAGTTEDRERATRLAEQLETASVPKTVPPGLTTF